MQHQTEVLLELSYQNIEREWWKPIVTNPPPTFIEKWQWGNNMCHGPCDHRNGACKQCSLVVEWCACYRTYTIDYDIQSCEDKAGNRRPLPSGPWGALQQTTNIRRIN